MSQHIVITGVSRGLGRAMTEAFIAAGHRVSGCARNAEAIAALSTMYPAPHLFTTLISAMTSALANGANR